MRDNDHPGKRCKEGDPRAGMTERSPARPEEGGSEDTKRAEQHSQETRVRCSPPCKDCGAAAPTWASGGNRNKQKAVLNQTESRNSPQHLKMKAKATPFLKVTITRLTFHFPPAQGAQK